VGCGGNVLEKRTFSGAYPCALATDPRAARTQHLPRSARLFPGGVILFWEEQEQVRP
jgi:hypothetical protein